MKAGAAAVLFALAAGAGAQPAATVERTGDAIVFDGRIEAGSAARFLELLRDPEVTRLVITSRGGIVSAALDMADAIHRRELDVEVPSACHSSCANYVFPAGRRKILGWPGAVAWHGNMTHVLYLAQSGQARWSDSELEGAYQLARRESEFFGRIGVDGFVCWFGKIEPYNVDESYYLPVQDLAPFGLREVTVRAARGEAAGVQPIAVDWAGLQGRRPAVRLAR